MRSLLALAVTIALISTTAFTQSKRPLTHDVYDTWNRITGESISPDGSWGVYTLGPAEGDPRLIVLHLTDGKADTILRATGSQITNDSRYAVFLIKARADSVKKAKIAKKKPDEMPADSVGIARLGTPGITVLPRAKSFALPEKGSGWVAVLLEQEIAPKDSARKKTDRLDEGPGDKEKKTEKGTTLVVRELESGFETRVPFTSAYRFSKDGRRLLIATTGNDSTLLPSVLIFDTATKEIDTAAAGKGSYKQLAWDESGTEAAFVADRDTSKNKQRFYTLMYWKEGLNRAEAAVDSSTAGFRKGWMVSEHAAPWFSKDGRTLYFGTAPVPLPDDTTFNDVETPALDVWNWQDGFIQSHQLKNLENEKKRSYTALLHLADRRFVQVGDTSLQRVITGSEGNASVALGFNDLPYRRIQSWEDATWEDVYLVDLQTGARTLILPKMRGTVALSPASRYVSWYDFKQRHWYALNVGTGTRAKLTGSIKVPLYNELNDVPDDPGPHGTMGWMENDSLLFIYDRFDIWAVDPAGARDPACLTLGEGRKSNIQFRALILDPEQRFFRRDSTVLLSAFNIKDKRSGFFSVTLTPASRPGRLQLGPYRFGTPIKAKSSPALLVRRMDFATSELFTSTTALDTLRKISDTNPQQKEYLWGTVELVSWRAQGKPVEGLLYKPENFDPARKYPMLVYYYERNSDFLHQYIPPAPSASTINRTYCVSNGYLVFVPDIWYRTGHPGESAAECIIPGVRALIKAGFVDPSRIGIQGQSWGGYQTAFLVTRTSMFRCAFAGAVVSNMTSAYGGIRLESGRVREFQYEHAQSRIGTTLWQKPGLYIENSPLFRADSVRTPLLLMHNDNDGAVPWQQGIEFFTALRRLGKPVWMLVYNNEEHNLVQTKNRKDLSRRMMQFFDHFLKGAPMPVWMSRGLPAINKGKVLGYELEPPGTE